VMVMEVAAAAGGDPAALLAPVAAAQGVEVSVNAVDADLF
jgi:hypothetical protein